MTLPEFLPRLKSVRRSGASYEARCPAHRDTDASALAGAGALVTSTIASEGALLSGSAKRERATDATGGLLRRIGDHGILVVKDVTSILSMDRHPGRVCSPRSARSTMAAGNGMSGPMAGGP